AGIEQFVFVTGRNKGAIEDHFDHAFELEDTLNARKKTAELKQTLDSIIPAGNAIFTRQQQPLGLGHAVWCARHWIGDEPFAVLLPDEMTLATPSCTAQLVDVHKRTGGNVISVLDVPREQTNRYGIVATGKDDGSLAEVTGMVEKPKPEAAPSTLAIIGRYVLLPEVFKHLDKQERGAGNEIQLTDALAKMVGNTPFHALRFTGERHDCGNRLGFLEANLALGLKNPDIAGELREIVRRLLND
ncbi:MAG: UTP--glucose-1-phosphate uridylyltransferase, partial [Rhodospirillales bacterium]